MNHNNSNDHLVGSFTIFFILALLASTTLLAAGVVWLSDLLGSTLAALALVGSIAALLAATIYFASLRHSIRQMRERMESLSEVAHLANIGYRWVIKRIISLLE